MTSSIKNIIVAGATGSVGAPILKALIEEASFNVTILSRASSSATFPNGIPVKKVSDDFTVAELTEAFKGQDAVVSAISTLPVITGDGNDGLAFRLIDAAVSAGIKRFIPSEYGANNLDPRARSTVPVYDRKGAMLEYLIEKAKQSSLTWTSISCGSWLDWALNPKKSGNFLFIDVKGRKATIYDSGRNRFAVTTSTNTGLAVARALLNPDLTANKQVYLTDFTSNSIDIVQSLEKQTGERWTLEKRESEPEIKALRAAFDGGDVGSTFKILAITFVADVDVGYDFEREQQIWNSRLGLPTVTLDEVVREAIELANGS